MTAMFLISSLPDFKKKRSPLKLLVKMICKLIPMMFARYSTKNCHSFLIQQKNPTTNKTAMCNSCYWLAKALNIPSETTSPSKIMIWMWGPLQNSSFRPDPAKNMPPWLIFVSDWMKIVHGINMSFLLNPEDWSNPNSAWIARWFRLLKVKLYFFISSSLHFCHHI